MGKPDPWELFIIKGNQTPKVPTLTVILCESCGPSFPKNMMILSLLLFSLSSSLSSHYRKLPPYLGRH